MLLCMFYSSREQCKNTTVECEMLRVSPKLTAGEPTGEMARMETGTDFAAHKIRTL